MGAFLLFHGGVKLTVSVPPFAQVEYGVPPVSVYALPDRAICHAIHGEPHTLEIASASVNVNSSCARSCALPDVLTIEIVPLAYVNVVAMAVSSGFFLCAAQAQPPA